jgi:hypothetical protein
MHSQRIQHFQSIHIHDSTLTTGARHSARVSGAAVSYVVKPPKTTDTYEACNLNGANSWDSVSSGFQYGTLSLAAMYAQRIMSIGLSASG